MEHQIRVQYLHFSSNFIAWSHSRHTAPSIPLKCVLDSAPQPKKKRMTWSTVIIWMNAWRMFSYWMWFNWLLMKCIVSLELNLAKLQPGRSLSALCSTFSQITFLSYTWTLQLVYEPVFFKCQCLSRHLSLGPSLYSSPWLVVHSIYVHMHHIFVYEHTYPAFSNKIDYCKLCKTVFAFPLSQVPCTNILKTTATPSTTWKNFALSLDCYGQTRVC